MNKDTHPFYQHSDADFFIAEEKGKTLGRIAAISNTRANRSRNLNCAYFYFFECVDNKAVSEALFSEVIAWAKSKGHDQVYGPKGFLQGDGIGLLVKGFDYVPAVGIQKVKERSGFWVKRFETKQELLDVVQDIRHVYNGAFEGSEGFSPVTEEEIVVIAKRLLSLADPRLIKLVYKEDQIIGFLFSYPNICRGLQKTNGRMLPFGWFHILREFKTTKYMDTNGIGILPEYQGLGPTAVIYTELEKTFQEFDFEHIETVQTREDNIASLGESSHFVMDWVKTHRVYEQNL